MLICFFFKLFITLTRFLFELTAVLSCADMNQQAADVARLSRMNNPHPQILTPCVISPSLIALHLAPSPDVSSLCPPSCKQRPGSVVLSGPVCADRCRGGCSGQAQQPEQHLCCLPETRSPGAEVPHRRQALPSELFQVSTEKMAAKHQWSQTYFWHVREK